MASAALKQQEAEAGTEIPGEGQDNDAETGHTERDFDAEAREHGWSPKEEFKGDPTRWVDAETFMKRADDVMPLLKAQNARLKRDLDAIKKDLRRATTHFEGAEKRAFDKAKAELQQKVEDAIESGDLAAGKQALKDMEELSPEPAAKPKYTKEMAEEAFDGFRDEHAWFDRANLAGATELEINGRLFADRTSEKLMRQYKDDELPPPDEFYAAVAEAVYAKYPALKGKPARAKPASAVEGGGAGKPGRSRGWDSLPDGARKQYQRFIDRGIGVKSTGDADKDIATAKAYYAKTHDWEGYKE